MCVRQNATTFTEVAEEVLKEICDDEHDGKELSKRFGIEQ